MEGLPITDNWWWIFLGYQFPVYEYGYLKYQSHSFHFLFLVSVVSRHGIITGTTPGMASQNTPHSKIKPLYRTMFLNCFERIRWTSRREPTRGRSKGWNTNPVKIDGNKQEEGKYLSQNSRNEYPRGRYPGVMRFHENSFRRCAQALFSFSLPARQ